METAQLAWAGPRVLLGGAQVAVHNARTLAAEGSCEYDDSAAGDVVAIRTLQGDALVVLASGWTGMYATDAPRLRLKVSLALPLPEDAPAVAWAAAGTLGNKSLAGFAALNPQAPHKSGDHVILFAAADAAGLVASVHVYNIRTQCASQLWAAPEGFAATHFAAAFPDPHTLAIGGAKRGAAAVHTVLLEKYVQRVVVASAQKVTALAVHPFRTQVSIGDGEGRIKTWLLPEQTMKQVHWHAHDVAALAWSPDGTVLMSGGEEAVVCLWNARSWEVNKIPRLGAPILSATWSADSAALCIALAPSQLLLLDVVQRRPVRTVHGAQVLRGLPCERLEPVSTASGECVALFGEGVPNCVRIFDPFSRAYVKTVRVAAANASSRVDTAPLPVVEARHVAFAPTGAHMATVERSDVSSLQQARETTLRFWHAAPDAALEFSPNTFIAAPHGASEVVGLAMSPVREVCWTASADGCVKRWAFSPSGCHWRNTAGVSLASGQAQALGVAADGSALGVCSGGAVEVLRAADLLPLQRLEQHVSAAALEQVAFVKPRSGAEAATHAVARSATHILVWDVTAGSLVSAVALPTEALCVCKDGLSYVVVTRGTVLRFEGSASAPSGAARIGAEGVRSMMVAHASRGGANLVLCTDATGSLVHMPRSEAQQLFGTQPHAADADGDDDAPAPAPAAPQANLAGLFARSAAQPQQKLQHFAAPYKNPGAACAALGGVYTGDTHTMPPPTTALAAALDAVLTLG